MPPAVHLNVSATGNLKVKSPKKAKLEMQMAYDTALTNYLMDLGKGEAEPIQENGPDPYCPDWKPAQEASLPTIQTIPMPSDPPNQLNLAKTIRAHLLEFILSYFFLVLADRSRKIKIMSCLSDPSQYEGMEARCYLRKHLVWPRFGSTRPFHDFLLQFVPDATEPYAFFPEDHPAMTIHELVSPFEAHGDGQGARLAKLNQFINIDNNCDCIHGFNRAATHLYGFRQDGYL